MKLSECEREVMNIYNYEIRGDATHKKKKSILAIRNLSFKNFLFSENCVYYFLGNLVSIRKF